MPSEIASVLSRTVSEDWDDYAAKAREVLAGDTDTDPATAAIRRLSGSEPIAAAIAAPDKLASIARGFPAIIERAAREEDADAGKKVRSGVVILMNLANALECVGIAATKPALEIFHSWLPRIDVHRNDESTVWYWDTGFAALALDDIATAKRFAGVGPKEKFGFTPKQTFGYNLQGLLRHLAGAIETKASRDAIEPAWRELLDNFETHWSANSVDYTTLLWIGRIVEHRIAGHPLASVGTRLHDRLWGAA